jgi:hypothetical protein
VRFSVFLCSSSLLYGGRDASVASTCLLRRVSSLAPRRVARSLLLSLVVLLSLCVFRTSIFVSSAHRSHFVPRFSLSLSLSLSLVLQLFSSSTCRACVLPLSRRTASLLALKLRSRCCMMHALLLRVFAAILEIDKKKRHSAQAAGRRP